MTGEFIDMNHTYLLVVGAGPYGIATAAYAKSLGMDVTIVGKPLESWKMHMPKGMYLRSGPDWHLDAREDATFQAYARARGLTDADLRPIPLETFVAYATWFMGRYDLAVKTARVTLLRRARRGYVALLDDGSSITAQRVVLAPGFAPFKHCPNDLVDRLPPGSYTHTSDAVELETFRAKRVLIVGGRQSAFEWAALMSEQGAEQIHLAHRHATPTFARSDWSWVQPTARRMLHDHGWWRGLRRADQERISRDLWAAGRLALEPWLAARVERENVHVHPQTEIVTAVRSSSHTIDVALEDDSRVDIHHIVLATGYRPDIRRLVLLDRRTILDRLETAEAYPMLDTEFQTNLPGLYITGLPAARDFGPFLGFTVAAPIAARIIGEHIAAGYGRTRNRSCRQPSVVRLPHAAGLAGAV